MQVTVEAVAREGHGFKDSVGWKNADKKSGLNFKDLHPGDVIDIEVNAAGFVTAYKLVTAGEPKLPKKAWKAGSTNAKSSEFRTTEQIIRSVAAEAVFQSPAMADLTKDMGKEQAVSELLSIAKRVVQYIEKGE